MNDIFISHSSKDNEIALKYYNVLTERGFKCWMDLFNIPPGENYRVEIPAAIKNCQYFVFLLSEHSQISKYAGKEFIIAEDEGKIIIPINIDGCSLNESWKWSLSDTQILTSSRNVNEDVEKIVSTLSISEKSVFQILHDAELKLKATNIMHAAEAEKKATFLEKTKSFLANKNTKLTMVTELALYIWFDGRVIPCLCSGYIDSEGRLNGKGTAKGQFSQFTGDYNYNDLFVICSHNSESYAEDGEIFFNGEWKDGKFINGTIKRTFPRSQFKNYYLVYKGEWTDDKLVKGVIASFIDEEYVNDELINGEISEELINFGLIDMYEVVNVNGELLGTRKTKFEHIVKNGELFAIISNLEEYKFIIDPSVWTCGAPPKGDGTLGVSFKG